MQATNLSVKHSKWRRGTLIALVVCAAASFAARGHTLETIGVKIEIAPAALLTLAVGFALASIVTSRIASLVPPASARTHGLMIASQLSALGIGATGIAMAWITSDWQRGVLFAVAGAIFCLRPMALKPGPAPNP